MFKIVSCYIPGDMEAALVGDTAYIDPSAKNTPYKYRRLCMHEKAHYETCPFDLVNAPRSTREKYEHIADRSVAKAHMPVERIVDLVLKGVDSLEEIAHSVRLDCEYICKMLKLYADIYGNDYRSGDYVVSFAPLAVAAVPACET